MFSVQKSVRQLLWLFAITMLFYTFQRFVYYSWNSHFFLDANKAEILRAFVWGLRYDIFAICAIAIPSVILVTIPIPKRHTNFYLKFQLAVFILLQIPAYILNQVDVEFSNFAGRRFTFGNLHILNEASNKITSYIITHGALIFAQILILLSFVISCLKVYQCIRESKNMWPRSAALLVVFMIFPLATLGIRGGFQRKPLNTTHAILFDTTALNNLMINSTFTVIKGQSKRLLKDLNYFSSEEMVKLYLNGQKHSGSVFKDDLSKTKTNVVFIILESFALEYMGNVNKTTGFTPFLDELSEKGLFFRNAYANARRSIEAIPSITSGIPTLMPDAFVKSPYFENELIGLGTYFKKKGYKTSFFHGGLPGTMYFDIYTQKAGFDDYYSARNYPDPKHSDGYWGIWDEEFFAFASDKLSEIEEPFLTSIFSLTSHHPYKVPEKYAKRLPAGELPILQTIAYTDLALRIFFERAKKEKWFNNTLFVITADHTQQAYLDEFKNPLGRYRVPIIFYHPNYKFPEIDTDMIAQHIDILPTLLDMFKIKEKHPLFGKSFFAPGPRYAVLLDDQIFYYKDSDLCLKQRGFEEPSAFDCSKDPLFRKPAGELVDRELAKKRLKATLQYFHSGMIYNKIYNY